MLIMLMCLRSVNAQCPAGQAFFNQFCYTCTENCATCTAAPDSSGQIRTSCTSCYNQYFLIYDSYFNGGSNRCSICPAGQAFYPLLFNQFCFPCPENCATCTAAPNSNGQIRTTCTRCNDRYVHVYDPYFNGGSSRCLICPDNCKQCSIVEVSLSGRVSYFTRCNSGQCDAGYYRNVERTCSACTVCSTGQALTTACLGDSNANCKQCSSGEYVAPFGLVYDDPSGISWMSYFCVQCPGGKYVAENRQSCIDCTLCASTQYVPDLNRCSPSQNTVCTNCPGNKAVTYRNMASCDTCATGFFSMPSASSFVCERCTEHPCGANPPTFISCVNAARTCEICTGTTPSTACPVGQEANKTCDGTSTQGSSCRNCLAGSERPAGSNSLKCEKCKTGFFKDAPSTANCSGCTNAPANAFYVSWGTLEAIANNCPW